MSKANGRRHVSLSMVIVLVAVCALALPVSGREKSDVIVMKNGDMITCEIKSLRSNTLYISIDYILGTVSVDWTKVAHVESKQLFLVKTQDGTVYKGALSSVGTPGEHPVEIEILESPQKKVSLKRTEVATMDETSQNVWGRFSGEIGSGVTYAKGNESTQYNLNTQVGYTEERWSGTANYSSNLNASAGVSTSTRNDFMLSGMRLLRWRNWFYTGVGDFLQSSTQGIRLQTTLGGGIGRHIKNTGSTIFSVYGGFGWQQIQYEQSVIDSKTQYVTSGLIGTALEVFRFDRTNLAIKASLLPSISEPGRVHFNLNSTYYVKIWGKLNWNVTFYGNWDNRPPQDISGSDYGTSSGLSLSFGNR